MNRYRACSRSTEFSSSKNGRAKKFPIQNSGVSTGRRPTARLKFFFSRLIANDSVSLQSALAARAHFFPAGLSRENVPARRLPEEVWAASRNLRAAAPRTIVLAKTRLAARGQCRGSDHRAETGRTDSNVEAGPAFCSDHDDDYRICFRESKCAELDRSHVQPARLLANHALRLCHDPAQSNRSD